MFKVGLGLGFRVGLTLVELAVELRLIGLANFLESNSLLLPLLSICLPLCQVILVGAEGEQVEGVVSTSGED